MQFFLFLLIEKISHQIIKNLFTCVITFKDYFYVDFQWDQFFPNCFSTNLMIPSIFVLWFSKACSGKYFKVCYNFTVEILRTETNFRKSFQSLISKQIPSYKYLFNKPNQRQATPYLYPSKFRTKFFIMSKLPDHLIINLNQTILLSLSLSLETSVKLHPFSNQKNFSKGNHLDSWVSLQTVDESSEVFFIFFRKKFCSKRIFQKKFHCLPSKTPHKTLDFLGFLFQSYNFIKFDKLELF